MLLRPHGKGLIGTTLNFDYEVRSSEADMAPARVIDACAVAFRFAAATLSRDTLSSGPFTVGRAVASEMPTRTSTIPIQVVAAAARALRTNHERLRNMARRPRPRRPPSRRRLAR